MPMGLPPPPLAIPGGNRDWAPKAEKIQGAEGAKEKFYKAPKLIYSVILWYSFVVQFPAPPPPPWGEPSRHWWGGGRYFLGGPKAPIPSGKGRA